MSNRDDQHEHEHFDELDAVRRFPSEDSWLDLPMPDLSGAPGDRAAEDRAAAGDSTAGDSTAEDDLDFASPSAFADRVLKARQDDLELDARIAELDQALPADVLAQFTAPEPSASFVERTVQKATHERRQRWQKMLSRYVAPEPSPEFVSKTLAALQEDGSSKAGGSAGSSLAGSSSAGSSLAGSSVAGSSPALSSASRNQQQEPRQLEAPRDVQRRNQNRTVFGLVAAAAAALLWVSLSGEVRAPLEVRLADQASPAVAYASSTSPMSAILAQVAEDEEPFAMFDEPADGLWLISELGDGSADGEDLR